MGDYFRRFWQPALLSEEVPAPDSSPVRVTLMGERLIAFRDTSGRVGLVARYCRHRQADLFFGRNEEGGLRCAYQGCSFQYLLTRETQLRLADASCREALTPPNTKTHQRQLFMQSQKRCMV